METQAYTSLQKTFLVFAMVPSFRIASFLHYENGAHATKYKVRSHVYHTVGAKINFPFAFPTTVVAR